MDVEAEFEAALAHHRAGDLAKAEGGYRAILTRGDHLASLKHLSLIAQKRGDFDAAADLRGRVVALTPDDAEAQYQLAIFLRITGRHAESEAAHRRVLELAPDHLDAAVGLGSLLLARGDFVEGWARYEARPMRRRLVDGLALPEWRGEPLAGKRLLIWREQGFGDQIMMARFLPALAEARVTYAGSPALRRLFSHLPAAFVEADPETIDLGAFDCWVLPMSLPQRLGVTPATLPAPPYLFGQASRRGGIGVAWRGEPSNVNDRFRSLPQAMADRLLALPGAVSLDPADSGAADFQATADLIAGLDLVVTADTGVAHLAGALGGPVWVMLARQALDWHWPRQGPSIWYPQARMFIQAEPGDWGPVVDAVCREAAVRPRR